jgi:hypothetical protein
VMTTSSSIKVKARAEFFILRLFEDRTVSLHRAGP